MHHALQKCLEQSADEIRCRRRRVGAPTPPQRQPTGCAPNPVAAGSRVAGGDPASPPVESRVLRGGDAGVAATEKGRVAVVRAGASPSREECVSACYAKTLIKTIAPLRTSRL